MYMYLYLCFQVKHTHSRYISNLDCITPPTRKSTGWSLYFWVCPIPHIIQLLPFLPSHHYCILPNFTLFSPIPCPSLPYFTQPFSNMILRPSFSSYFEFQQRPTNHSGSLKTGTFGVCTAYLLYLSFFTYRNTDTQCHICTLPKTLQQMWK